MNYKVQSPRARASIGRPATSTLSPLRLWGLLLLLLSLPVALAHPSPRRRAHHARSYRRPQQKSTPLDTPHNNISQNSRANTVYANTAEDPYEQGTGSSSLTDTMVSPDNTARYDPLSVEDLSSTIEDAVARRLVSAADVPDGAVEQLEDVDDDKVASMLRQLADPNVKNDMQLDTMGEYNPATGIADMDGEKWEGVFGTENLGDVTDDEDDEEDDDTPDSATADTETDTIDDDAPPLEDPSNALLVNPLVTPLPAPKSCPGEDSKQNTKQQTAKATISKQPSPAKKKKPFKLKGVGNGFKDVYSGKTDDRADIHSIDNPTAMAGQDEAVDTFELMEELERKEDTKPKKNDSKKNKNQSNLRRKR